MKKFQNKYRIPSARLQNWDYGSNGAYFITICCKNMEHYFGNVETQFIASDDTKQKSEMQLNELGQIAYEIWESVPNQFPYVELGSFVIMPNHVHGILIIDKKNAVETRFIASPHNDDRNGITISNHENAETRLIASIDDDDRNAETRLIASLRKGGFSGDVNPMINENISRIIRWYKGRCSFEMRKIHPDFNWLSRYHDHIIKDSKSFDTIQNYIENNPSKWNEDKFNIK